MGYEKRISKAEKDYVEIKKHVSGLITPVVGVLIVALLYNLLLFAFPFFGDNSMLFNVLAIGGNIFVMLILALTVVRWYYDRYYAKENTLVILRPFSTSEIDLIGRRFEVKQGIVDKMFNKGTIALSDAISLSGDEKSSLVLKNIKDPYETIERIAHFNNMPNDKKDEPNMASTSNAQSEQDITDADRKEFEEFKKWKQSQKGNAS